MRDDSAKQQQQRDRVDRNGNVQCYNCKGYGHVARSCPQLKESTFSQGNNSNNAKKVTFNKTINSVKVDEDETEIEWEKLRQEKRRVMCMRQDMKEMLTKCERINQLAQDQELRDKKSRGETLSSIHVGDSQSEFRLGVLGKGELPTVAGPTQPVDIDNGESQIVNKVRQTLERPDVTQTEVYEAIHELMSLTVDLDKLGEIIPLLKQYMQYNLPFRPAVKVVLQKYGQHLRRITKINRKIQINVRTNDGRSVIILTHAQSKVRKLRQEILQTIPEKPNMQMLLSICGQCIDDDEY